MTFSASKRAADAILDWATRDRWADQFKDHLELHLGDSIAEFGLEAGDLSEVLGGHYPAVMSVILEDFVTRALALEDGTIGDTGSVDTTTVIDDYLKRRGFKESQPVKEYLRALRDAPLDLYEVVDTIPGSHFIARSLIRDAGGPELKVEDRLGSQSLKRWDRIAARVFPLRGRMVMSGGGLRYDIDLGRQLLDMAAKFCTALKADRPTWIQAVFDEEPDPAIREDLEGALVKLALDREMPRMVVGLWLDRVLAIRTGLTVPTLVNAEGHDVTLCTTRFPLLADASTAAVIERLATVTGLQAREDDDALWTFMAAQVDDDSPRTIEGSVEIDDGEVRLSTNSIEREARLGTLVAQALDGLVGDPIREQVDPAEAMRSGVAPSTTKRSEIPPDMKAQVAHELADRHYRTVLDKPVQILGNATPREAAGDPARQAEIVDWLKLIENGSASNPDLAGYDVTWMWRELGLERFRR